MKFCVIGEPCIDYIHRNNVTRKNLGGILYCVVSLSVISGSNNEIVPIMNVGTDEYDTITGFLKGFRNINISFIKRVKNKTRVVNLYYNDPLTLPSENLNKTYDREESSTEPTPPIDYDWIHPALSAADGLLISMISGVDITLETFKEIRKNFNNYIHFDAHNIVMRTYPDGRRIQEPVENWKDWCTPADTLQMNESELKIITPEKLREYDFADTILTEGNTGTKALVVTRGKTGVTLFRKTKKEVVGEKYLEIDRMDLPSAETINFVDSTGCGDVFASCFFYKNALQKKPDYTESLYFANKKASTKTSFAGVEELYRLND
ncbi:MAG: carbohydrate kinase family protein [Ignavibacteria bacterium]|jgi:sugar/nucleoside kinase (ribokinase family)